MILELPEQMEEMLKMKAHARGLSLASFVQEVLQRELGDAPQVVRPFKTGRGSLAKYGPAPSAEEIDANRAEMFRNFGEDF